jgi:hypothetical protein
MSPPKTQERLKSKTVTASSISKHLEFSHIDVRTIKLCNYVRKLSVCFFFSFFIRYFLHLYFKCYPQSPLYPPPTLLPNPPTSASWPWHSPVLGHIIFTRPRASPPTDGRPGHPLLHMQLETQLWGGGVLVSSYCCPSYRVADHFRSLGTFSSSFIRGPVFHPIDDCELLISINFHLPHDSVSLSPYIFTREVHVYTNAYMTAQSIFSITKL